MDNMHASNSTGVILRKAICWMSPFKASRDGKATRRTRPVKAFFDRLEDRVVLSDISFVEPPDSLQKIPPDGVLIYSIPADVNGAASPITDSHVHIDGLIDEAHPIAPGSAYFVSDELDSYDFHTLNNVSIKVTASGLPSRANIVFNLEDFQIVSGKNYGAANDGSNEVTLSAGGEVNLLPKSRPNSSIFEVDDSYIRLGVVTDDLRSHPIITSARPASPYSIDLDIRPLPPQISITPSSLSFSNIAGSGEQTQTFTIANTGPTGSILAGDIEDIKTGPFSIVFGPNGAGAFALGYGKTRRVDVAFQPGTYDDVDLHKLIDIGTYTTIGVISHHDFVALDASNQPPVSTPSGQISITPTAIPFGSVQVNQQKTEKFTVTNTGPAGSVLTGNVGALVAPFSVLSGGGAFSLASGESRDVVVSFKPGARDLGQHSGTVLVSSDDPDSSDSNIALNVTGNGVQPATGQMVVTPSTINFGSTTIRRNIDVSFTISNVGGPGSVLTGTVNPPAAPFYIVSVGANPGPGTFSIQAGKSITVKARFLPLLTITDPFLGSKTSSIAIVTPAPQTPSGSRETRVYLSGIAEGAKPTGFKLIARPASNPDDGVLRVDIHFGSTSGVVEDIINHAFFPANFFTGIFFRELLSVKGSSANPARLPKPFKGPLSNPPGGQEKSQWSTAFIVVHHVNDASIDDAHGYTASNPLSPSLRSGSFTLVQRFEYKLPWVNGGKWTPVPNSGFEVIRSVTSVRKQGLGAIWEYSVRIGKDIRVLPLTLKNRRTYHV